MLKNVDEVISGLLRKLSEMRIGLTTLQLPYEFPSRILLLLTCTLKRTILDDIEVTPLCAYFTKILRLVDKHTLK